MGIQERRILELTLCILGLMSSWAGVESKCSDECDALASYYVWKGANLTFISNVFSTTIKNIQRYNPQITNPDLILAFSRINVPFSCGCVDGEFMGHQFHFRVKSGNTYNKIAKLIYSNLTSPDMLARFNSYRYSPSNVPADTILNVTVNCSCGDSDVSEDYGLFITYPLRPSQSSSGIALDFGLPEKLLKDYNPGLNFSQGSGLVFIPGKDQNGIYPRLKKKSSSGGGISAGAIAGIIIGSGFGVMSLAACSFLLFYRNRKIGESNEHNSNDHVQGPLMGANSPRPTGITLDKSVEFSYEELAKATNNFSMASKIGQGGFGAVFYGELRGEKAAVKTMDMQASKEFLAELKVLTHVHHLNLVHLIGYCVHGSLFLVYEYIENGNLSQHLRGSGRDPLTWPCRVQIALDAARGLEYIHEHTVHVYIHRDIKSANILIDKDFRAKVADFGLAKLTEGGSTPLNTRPVGTFGYMPPEYARYGDVSPKIDVYAFGVVLYELISAKEAIIKTDEVVTESRGLVSLFEDVLESADPPEGICKLVDPRLGDDYPFDSVRKMACLAKACTHEDPQLRPNMRSIVVALMTLSPGSFYKN